MYAFSCMLEINWFDTFWPSLLKVKGFLQRFQTPLIKTTHKRTKEVTPYFSQAAFDAWKATVGVEGEKQYWVKFYKGLGTSTPKEAKQYFKDLPLHRKDFVWASERCTEALESAFGKNTNKRKELINRQDLAVLPGEELSYETFINHQLRDFALAVLRRAIPSLVDGFKPVQRKVSHSIHALCPRAVVVPKKG
jgi:DNA topoisomerase-2